MLAAIPKPALDAWVERLRSWRIFPNRIESRLAPGIDLSSAFAGQTPKRRLPRARTLVYGAIGFVVLAAAALPLWQLREVAVRLNEAVASLSPAAGRLPELTETRDATLAKAQFLVDRKIRHEPVGVMLAELARLLPDGTWLRSLQYRNGELTIQGYTSSASDLIPLIEGSPLFDSVRFGAPITRDHRLGKEVFQVQMAAEAEQP
jgi:general secretion pathway protein L